jgi:hypothetical protein
MDDDLVFLHRETLSHPSAGRVHRVQRLIALKTSKAPRINKVCTGSAWFADGEAGVGAVVLPGFGVVSLWPSKNGGQMGDNLESTVPNST